MGVDDLGLVHGGFIFGLADYAAMIAVNHPNVALGAADVKFLKPARVGDTLTAEARIESRKGKKLFINAQVAREGVKIFEGSFTCVIPDNHVLE
jgi:acyl-coenzyme A thioesterase PaaI-like protein